MQRVAKPERESEREADTQTVRDREKYSLEIKAERKSCDMRENKRERERERGRERDREREREGEINSEINSETYREERS